MSKDDLLSQLLDLEREISRSKRLAVFRRNPSTWELLLYLGQTAEGSEDGLYHIVDSLQTRYLGSSAMLKFMRERRDDGLLLFAEHAKRSKWAIALNPELRAELLEVLTRHAAQLPGKMAEVSLARKGAAFREGHIPTHAPE